MTPKTPPTDLAEQLRLALERNPSLMLSNLAEQFAVPEGVIMEHLPKEMRTFAPAEAFETIWQDAMGWEKALFFAITPGAVIEYAGPLPGGAFGHGMFNLKSEGNPLGGHLLIQRLGSIWFLSKPHFGKESHSIQFYTREGAPMFALYVGRGADRELLPEVKAKYLALRSRYAGDGA